MSMQTPETLLLTANGWVPNNPRLPVLLYRNVLAIAGPDAAAACEQLFQRNHWPPAWRNSVYPFHHYHSTAHEVLGFVAGEAQLVLGGPDAHDVLVSAGDVAVLPAGTGHFKQHASDNFLVVGGYPPGQSADLCRSTPTPRARATMATLAIPTTDPVHGTSGPLTARWHP